MKQLKKQTGFTIVELLIVIVVIGILAAITIVAYNGVQSRAHSAKIDSDLAQLEKAIRASRQLSGETFLKLSESMGSNQNGAGRGCWSEPSGTDLAVLDKTTDSCWTDYRAVLSIISKISGIEVSGLLDPWGRPYFIDQNEGEYNSTDCREDIISTYRRPFITGYENHDVKYERVLPNISSSCL